MIMKNQFALSMLSLTFFTNIFGSLSISEEDAEARREVEEWCITHFRMGLVSLDGEWESYVHYAAEDGTAVLPHDNCRKVTWFQQDTALKAVQIQQEMIVDSNNPVTVGHQNGRVYHDFFGVLTVTMTQKPNNTLASYEKANNVNEKGTLNSPPPKMCVFYIAASGPAEPVLYAHAFHDANCTLKGPETIIRPYIILTAR